MKALGVAPAVKTSCGVIAAVHGKLAQPEHKVIEQKLTIEFAVIKFFISEEIMIG